MFISEYIVYALILIAGLILFRQFFVALRHDRGRGVQPSLFSAEKNVKMQTFDEKMEIRKRMIVDRAHERGEITNNEVERLFGIAHTTAWRYLEELEGEGRLVQTGRTGRGVVYEPRIGAY